MLQAFKLKKGKILVIQKNNVHLTSRQAVQHEK